MFLAMIWIVISLQTRRKHYNGWHLAEIVGEGHCIAELNPLAYVGTVALIPYIFLFWQKKRFQMWMLPYSWGSAAVTVEHGCLRWNTLVAPIYSDSRSWRRLLSYGLFFRCLDLAAQGPSAKSSFRQLPSCCLQDFKTMSDSMTENLE